MSRLYFNGEIITMEGEGQYAEAVLEENGIIKAVGAFDMVKASAADDVELVDLAGKTMIPAFVDGHSHISMIRDEHARMDTNNIRSFDELIAAIKKFIADNDYTHGEAIMGWGYDHELMKEGKHPTKEILDQATTENPVIMSHVSGHVMCANSKALELSGITADTPCPQGGFIGTYEGTNEPNGYFEETAMHMVTCKEPETKEFLKGQIMSAQKMYAANGYSTAQDGGCFSKNQMDALVELAQEGNLFIDVEAYTGIMIGMGEGSSVPEQKEIYKDYFGKNNNHLKIAGLKTVLDGSPQARTAWMSEPYEGGEEGYCAYGYFKDEQVLNTCTIALENNLQLLAHCNGDAASEQFLNCYEMALANSSNDNKDKLRPVMIHSQTVRYDQLDRMAKIGMIPSFFIGHTYYWGDVHLKNFGQERGSRVSPCKAALDRGIIFNLHQDTPVTPPSMLLSIWAAVNRLSRTGAQVGTENKITPYDALRAATYGGAYSYFEEDKKGTLTVGKLADFAILSENPLKVDSLKIKDIEVMETIKEGKTIYSK